MGFVPKKKIYSLEFEDSDMEGLEVKMRGLSTGQLLDFEEARENASEDDEDSMRELFQIMADQLVSWNIEEEDGTPVPADMGGIRTLDLAFNMAIIDAWHTAMAGVPAPLESDSPSGDPSLEASIPMETLSLPPEPSAVPA